MKRLVIYNLLTLSFIAVCGSMEMVYPLDGCSRIFQETNCSFVYYCSNNLQSFHTTFVEDYDKIQMCRNRGQELPVYLIYNDTDIRNGMSTRMIPVCDYQCHIRLSEIVSLDISNNKYEFCPSLKTMHNLARLNLSWNSLYTAVLSNTNELNALREIDFSHNAINSIEINDFEHLYKKLSKLNFSYNSFTTIPEGIFEEFDNIKILDLSHNHIKTINALTFEGLKNMLQLNLSHNEISDINSSLLRFNKLIELDLSNNKIDNLKISDFEKLNELITLDLSFNELISINTTFQNLLSLQVLDLSNNKLNSIHKEAFLNVGQLKSVNLSQNSLKVLPKGMFTDKQIESFIIKHNFLEGALVKGMFEGLRFVRELDLSYQLIRTIEDFAFIGLANNEILLLNNNKINAISVNSFKALQHLRVLDLSNNELTNIDFNKEDLISLHSLLLYDNFISQVNPECFIGLNTLLLLDLSNNNITELKETPFKLLNELTDFKFFNNPLQGILRERVFEGLNSLPKLDISGTALEAVSNNSFRGMIQMKELNISHCSISELQFNTFNETGALKTLDLSHNQLRHFEVNTTDLTNLQELFLSNNLLTMISVSTLKGLPLLGKLVFSHNDIKVINDDMFIENNLKYLDLSFNSHLQFNVSLVEKLNLNILYLSGIEAAITFKDVGKVSIKYLECSYSGIEDILNLAVNKLNNLEDLVLSNNKIHKIENGPFSNITRLRKLDLSFNKLLFIQPGSFKDNIYLYSLNISHNLLTNINYGIFRGLQFLHTVDLSFNSIDNLDSERFYDVKSLSVLIADHNKISSINFEKYFHTSLTKLSIGGNPLPCSILANLNKTGPSLPFIVTAITIYESEENSGGISCNIQSKTKKNTTLVKSVDNENILVDIRDILQDLSSKNQVDLHSGLESSKDQKYLQNISSIIEKSSANTEGVFSKLINFTYSLVNSTKSLVNSNKNTNILLDKLVKILTTRNTVNKIDVIPVASKENANTDWLSYVNKIKEDLENTLAIEKQNILEEVETKLSENLHKETNMPTNMPSHEALSNNDKSESQTFVFIAVCVGLMLIMLVGIVLYKINNSGIFMPSSRRSTSSVRNLSDAMENSTL